MENNEEKQWRTPWNPFNSYWKLFATADRWRTIQRGQPIAPPRTVSIDPMNLCDEKCVFCNAEFIMDVSKGSKLQEEVMVEIPDFLYGWNDGRYGVESVCIGGGGESLLNKHTGKLIDGLSERGIGIGVVTNGTQIHNNLESLAKCTWVGVSINGGTRETYEKVHQKDEFNQVISNVKELMKYSEINNTKLAQPGHGSGISFKYLLHPYNVHEVLQATQLAKDMGVRNMHIRPVSPAWFELDTFVQSPHTFKPEHIEIFSEQMKEAMKLEDKNFGVYGVTHKFNPDFTPANDFESCYAIFMNGIIMPPSGRNRNQGKFDWGECCDRRGDDLLIGIKDGTDLNQIKEFWGSDRHWKMHDEIRVKQCPKCTFAPHNKIYQNAILENNMSWNFI